jgi:hypothetical protein
MHEYAILTWDDAEAAAGRRVPAAITVTLGLDWSWVELDLTAENEALLRQDVARWMTLGRPVTEPVLARPRPVLRNGEGKRRKGNWRPRDWERGKAWGMAIRAFADEHGYRYRNPSGKYYYSKDLRDAYAAHIGRE